MEKERGRRNSRWGEARGEMFLGKDKLNISRKIE
jgi:hypothetical protein